MGHICDVASVTASFLLVAKIPGCVGHRLFIHLPVVFCYYKQSCSEHLCVDICFRFPGRNSQHARAGSYGQCMFTLLRNYRTVFQSGCPTLHSRGQCARILVPAHPPMVRFFHLAPSDWWAMISHWFLYFRKPHQAPRSMLGNARPLSL